MDWDKKFKVTNISGGRVVTGVISIPHGDSEELNPNRLPSGIIESLQRLEKLGKITVSNSISKQKKSEEISPVSIVKTVKNQDGETNNHIVFDPNNKQKAITVESIQTDKPIKVESLTDNSPAVEVAHAQIDRIEAKEFLDQHWKRVESEVGKMTSKRKLTFYLEVAIQNEVADKKIEIIKGRLGQL